MKIAVGPLLFYWSKEDILAFYDSIKTMPVDCVYLGEVVCARRHEMKTEDWLDLASQLIDAGKEVVLSTQGLLESESDLTRVRKIVANGRCAVEANDHGAVALLHQHHVPFVAGMHLNIYNATTLSYFKKLGCFRWVPPVEMDKGVLGKLLSEMHTDIETELFCYGKMPLAFSARCFTARHYGLNKDDCQFKCQQHPDGLTLSTQEKQPFLSINGTQTQSAQSVNLIQVLDDMGKMGVQVARISPQQHYFENIVSAFDHARRQEAFDIDWSQANILGHCNGYWRGLAGMDYKEDEEQIL